jgi:thioesterase domain-containing protein
VLRRGPGASVVILPGSEGSLAGAASLISELPQDATVMTVEHPGLDPDHTLAERYADAVQANLVPGRKLIVVGISLGGRFAPETAAMLGRLDAWAHTAMDVYMLDSPASSASSEYAVRHHARLAFSYVGAKRGGLGSEEDNVARWKATFAGGKMYEVDCSHADLWGEAASKETARIIAAGSF